MSSEPTTFSDSGFDRGAAVTRSLLGWGVVAGPFYLIVGLVQAISREGFELSQHPLSVLMLGDFGWVQTTNLALTGLMAVAAGIGFIRVMDRRTPGLLVSLYGASLVASAVFPPDPMAGFPPGSAEVTTPSTSGLLHLAFGGIAFFAVAVAAETTGRWFRREGLAEMARLSRVAAVVIVIGFLGGAAVATSTAGVSLLWISVVTGLAWLLIASMKAYRIAPHPDGI